MSLRRRNVLISAAGRRVHLVDIFRTALEAIAPGAKVFAADITSRAAALHAADGAFIVPPANDEDFIPAVMELCQRWDVGLVVPTIDPELAPYARARAAFEDAGTLVAVSTPATIELCSSKVATNVWLRRNGFPTVHQWDLKAILSRTLIPTYPVVVKPIVGSSSVGVAKANDLEQVHALTRDGEFVVEEFAGGNEYTVDVFVDGRGRPQVPVPRQRLETRGGEVSKGLTVRLPDLETMVADIAAALPGAFGCLNVQVMLDQASGESNVIEINARFGGGFPLTWRAGADYAAWLLDEALGRRRRRRQVKWQDGLMMLRYDDALFVVDDSA